MMKNHLESLNENDKFYIKFSDVFYVIVIDYFATWSTCFDDIYKSKILS